MGRGRFLTGIIASVLLAMLFVPQKAFSAEVFYLGAGGANGPGGMNPSYSFGTRLKDLVDFTSKKDYKDRSGIITGSLMQEVAHNDIGGNTSKSFLRRGDDYVSELNLNMREKMWSDYNLEGQIFLRKTDNSRIETNPYVHIKNAQLKLYNDRNFAELGDFYADFSPYVLSNSLEGLHAKYAPGGTREYQFVAARVALPDVAANKFQRNVTGFKMDQFLLKDSQAVSNLRMGFQAVTAQDDSSSLERTASTVDMNNVVLSTDGELMFTQNPFSADWEVAHSYYIADQDSQLDNNRESANAYRVAPKLRFSKVGLRYLHELVQPKFYSDQGSAANDKIRHQLSADIELHRRASVSLTENYYWDHLPGSSRIKRTVNDEKDITFNLKPFEARESFSLRPYVRYAVKNSDDPANSAEGTTRTAGIAFNDSLGTKTNYGADYEYRSYTDEAGDKASSDFFHRVGLNFSHEQQFLSRRLYYTLGPSMDFRQTKTDDNQDVNFNMSLNGQYDISKVLQMRAGSQYSEANGAGPGTDYGNHRAFAEFDHSFRKGSTHFVLRAERNRYQHEDGQQSYREQRYIGKMVFRF